MTVELEKFYPWLVCFIPLIISAGGNSGSQSATLVITAMTSGQVEVPRLAFECCTARELDRIARDLGADFWRLSVGWLPCSWRTKPAIDALVIPLTLISVIICGCLCGATLPIVCSSGSGLGSLP